jgi:thymidylate kinase
MSSSRGGPWPPGRDGRPLIAEFVGTPGAGKSTLSTELVALLRERGVEAATVLGAARQGAARTLPGALVARLAPTALRGPLLWEAFYLSAVLQAFRFGTEHGSLTRHVLSSQLGRAIPAAAKLHILFWFLQLCGRYRFLTSARGPRVLVIDDGFLHRSVHLHASHAEAPDAGRVAAYVDLLPEPDVVFFVVADRDECERRVRRRGVWAHSRHLSPAELSRYVAHAERAAGLAVRRARERGWRVVEVVNESREPREVAADLGRAAGLLVPAAPMDAMIPAGVVG